MEIHWITILLTLWWFPNDTVMISNYHQTQGSDWTIDKAKLIYHYSSTEQYNPSSRQAKNIFPIQQPTPNNRDDNPQRYQHGQQFRNYNNNIQIQQQSQTSSNFGIPFIRQYPPVSNQFSPHWKNFSPPSQPSPPQSFPPQGNQVKITRPSLPDLLPPIIQNQNANPSPNTQINEKNHYQFKPSAPINPNPTIDSRIVTRPNKIPLIVPTQHPRYPDFSDEEIEQNSPRFSPTILPAQSLVTDSPKTNYEQSNSNTNRPGPVYLPQTQHESSEQIDSQSNSYHQQEKTIVSHSEEESSGNSLAQNLNPDREIRFLIHKAGDEQIIKNAISEESKYTNEQVSFIQGPDIKLQRRQKIYLPPKKKTVVYILLKEPQISTDVEVMEQDDDPKPEVYIIYQKGQEMLTRHYSADSNTLKTVRNLVLPPADEHVKNFLSGASSNRKETIIKAPVFKNPKIAGQSSTPAPLCLTTKPVTTTTRPARSHSSTSSSNPKNSLVKSITKS